MKKTIQDLEKLLNKYEYHYRVLNQPLITDQEFDKLTKQLKELSDKHPEFVTKDSPLNKIGEVLVDGFKKVEHKRLMGSIDNVYSLAELRIWGKKLGANVIFTLEDKYDGISGSIIYEDGILVQGATRGKGHIGDDITNNVKMVWNVPQQIEMAGLNELETRGEFVIFKKHFERINAMTGSEYKNPRNLVSGTMKSLDSQTIADRYVHFIPFQVFADGKEVGLDTISFGLIENQTFIEGDIDTIVDAVEKIAMTKSYKDKDYMVDGLVIKVKDLSVRQELGYTSKCPKWAIAFKFEQEQVKTEILDIIWQVGKSHITPVAILKPVEIEGTTVARATLHNITQYEELDARIGDMVEVEKAGFIIPHITKNLSIDNHDEKELYHPKTCPVCSEPTTIEDKGSKFLNCNNELCKGKKAVYLSNFVKALNIDDIGTSLVENLIEKELVKEYSDLFSLTIEDLLSIDRMGKKSATKIIKNILNAKTQELKNVIKALGIHHVGNSSSEKLADVVKTFDKFLTISEIEMINIPDFGEETVANIIEYRKNKAEELNKIQNIFQIVAQEESTDELTGKTFVITGKATLGRTEIAKIIKGKGGKVTSSVSKKIDYLILGSLEEPTFSSNKTKKANDLEIPIKNEFFVI